jgi:hypothetical protein
LRRGAGKYVTLTELIEDGITPKVVRHDYPWAVEYVALDGSPIWLKAEVLCEGGAD